MLRYAANVTMMWSDVKDPYESFRRAAAQGFSAVERVFIHDLDVNETHSVLSDLGLDLVLFDPYPGDWAAGYRGLLCVPGMEGELIESAKAAAEHAHVLGVDQMNVLAGVLREGQTPQDAYATLISGVEAILTQVDLGEVTVLLESVCGDVPGWEGSVLDTVELAAHAVREVDDPRVRLQFDAYHAGRAGVDPMKAWERHRDISRHVQIADHPGRHQPGTGALPIVALLDRLEEEGYAGYVGLEYIPKGTIEEALAWLPTEARAS